MYIFIFILIVAISQFITNKILNISDDNSIGYSYSKKDSLILLGFLAVGIILQLIKLKNRVFWISCIIYTLAILLTMIILATIKKVIITKQREELEKVFEILEPVLPKNAELDMNNPPFKLGYEKTFINKITITINPNTFKETVATNLCLSLNKFLPNYEWVNEFDFAARECSFIGTPLPPKVAKYQGSWLRPTEFIPIGLSGLGEVSWNLNSVKNEGRSNYIYEDGKIAKTVDTPSAPQALCVGSPLGLDTIIPTTTGYKTMKTIEVGDFVFGLDNKPVKVIQVHEIHKSTVYKLVFVNDFYKTTIISDEIHRFPVITKLRLSPLDKDFFKPVQCKDLQVNDIIAGKRENRLISKTKLNKEKLVRCITVDSNEHIFLVSDTKIDWNGGNTYTGPAIYTYNTGGKIT